MHFSINQIPAMSKSKTSDYVNTHRIMHLLQGRSVGSVSASRTIGHEFASRPGHTKDHHKNGTNCLPAWRAMR